MPKFNKLISGWLLCTSLLAGSNSFADEASARLAMENPLNPLLLLSTSQGNIYLELLPEEAPQNVERFIALAQGEVEFFDAIANTSYTPRYYDGMYFHRVIPGFVIQGGSPNYHPLGMPDENLDDEINASALGLDRLPVLAANGTINPILNVSSQTDFADRILAPLYQALNIDSAGDLEQQQSEVLSALQSLTVMRLYEYEGYDYQNRFPTRAISRGTLALANAGPNQNGPEFFIALTDSKWLNGRYTVIGNVVEGIEVADSIGSTAIDPIGFDPQSSVIYSIRRLN